MIKALTEIVVCLILGDAINRVTGLPRVGARTDHCESASNVDPTRRQHLRLEKQREITGSAGSPSASNVDPGQTAKYCS
jgi:hypothetical protein